MNKLITGVALFLLVSFSSCGGLDMCSCAEEALRVMDEIKEEEGNEAKIKEILSKNEVNKAECKQIVNDFSESIKGKYDSMEEAVKSEFGDCDALKKMSQQ